MRLSIYIFLASFMLFQGCTIITSDFGSSTLIANADEPFVYKRDSNSKVVIDLARVTGNDLTFMERYNFIKTLKEEINKSDKIKIGQSTLLHLKVVINKNPIQERRYKFVHKGFTEYHQDIRYKVSLNYSIVDRADFVAAKGTINYNVLVKASSYAGYDDAKRVGLKKLSIALAKKLARDINYKAPQLITKYRYTSKR